MFDKERTSEESVIDSLQDGIEVHVVAIVKW